MFISSRRSARQLYPSGMNQKKRNHCRLFRQKAAECRALRCLMALFEDMQESGEVATHIQQFRVLGGCCSNIGRKIQGTPPVLIRAAPPPPNTHIGADRRFTRAAENFEVSHRPPILLGAAAFPSHLQNTLWIPLAERNHIQNLKAKEFGKCFHNFNPCDT